MHKLWTAADDETLRSLYGVETMPAIGKKLGRTRNAINARVSKLGLKYERQPGEPMVIVPGNARPLRNQIAALGGRFRLTGRTWLIPKSQLPKIQALLDQRRRR